MGKTPDFDTFDDIEHRVHRVEQRVHYYKLGFPYAHHELAKGTPADEQLRWYAVEDIEEMLGFLRGFESLLGNLDTRENELENEKVAAGEAVKEAEEVRNAACLEAEELRDKFIELEADDEDTTIGKLKEEVVKLKGELAFEQRTLREKVDRIVILEADNRQALSAANKKHRGVLATWERRFEALPKTWQERLIAEDEKF